MAAPAKPLELYPITSDYELQIVLAEVGAPRFHEVIGHALNAEMMPTESAKLLVTAGQAIAKETGTGCSSPASAVQHLRVLCDKGKLTHAQVRFASDFIDTAKDLGGVPDLDELIALVTPIVQRFEHREALNDAIKDYGKGAGVDETVSRMERIAGLGKQRISKGSVLRSTEAAVCSYAQDVHSDLLPTGVPELDRVIEGGMEQPALGVVLGGPGAGKSLYLVNQTASALVLSYNVAYVTLELSASRVYRRIVCNLLDCTKEELAGNTGRAADRLHMLEEDGIGVLHVLYQSPRATTPGSIRTWLRTLEHEEGFLPNVLIVDYADKLVHRIDAKAKELGAYKEMEYVYEGLRDIAVERNCWVWTASQTTRGGLHNKRVDIEHAADSMNKSRVGDLIVAIARTHEDEAEGMLRFRVLKSREGAAHNEVGPLPMDASHGRITMFNRPAPWNKK